MFNNDKLTFSIPISTDEKGYLGKECPNVNCKGYFKITPGTGLSGIEETYCPYCGHKDKSSVFTTQDQIKYAKSRFFNQIQNEVYNTFKKHEFSTKPKGTFGIGIEVNVKKGKSIPIHEYRENELETDIVCSNCSLKYAIYGVFGYCPDCGLHNSIQILNKNFDVIIKIVTNLQSEDELIKSYQFEDSLIRVISLFDAFGREICKINRFLVKNSGKVLEIKFQNLSAANNKLIDLFNIDLKSSISDIEWGYVMQQLQKRHLLSHKMGIIDEDYVKKAGDTDAILGRKIIVSRDDVLNLIEILRIIAEYLDSSLKELPNTKS